MNDLIPLHREDDMAVFGIPRPSARMDVTEHESRYPLVIRRDASVSEMTLGDQEEPKVNIADMLKINLSSTRPALAVQKVDEDVVCPRAVGRAGASVVVRDDSGKGWLTSGMAARHLGCSCKTLYRLVAANKISAHHLGRHLRFLHSELDKQLVPTGAGAAGEVGLRDFIANSFGE